MLVAVTMRARQRPDPLRTRQSDRMIGIATKTTSLLRQGLTEETATEACTIMMDELPSISAVALTNARRVLGYAGAGCIDHQQWRLIKSVHTKDALREITTQLVPVVGCIDACCPLKSAIIVPFLLHDQAVGTLKFYYTDPTELTADEVAMAEGLAGLISVQLEVQELEKEAAFVREMELKMLQAQIDPHFLFNTLNTIASLTRTDPENARGLISNLAKFYRYTLEEGVDENTLQDSIDMMLNYFDLEHARFGDRLELYLDIDEALLDMNMPRFMLQPLEIGRASCRERVFQPV
jgi:two-component system sensor histidine kinase LytS